MTDIDIIQEYVVWHKQKQAYFAGQFPSPQQAAQYHDAFPPPHDPDAVLGALCEWVSIEIMRETLKIRNDALG